MATGKVRIVNQLREVDAGEVTGSIRREVEASQKKLLTEIQRMTPVDTGTMRKSWTVEVVKKSTSIALELTNDAPYAASVHYRGRKSELVIDAVSAYVEKEFDVLGGKIADALIQTINKKEK